MKSPWKFLTRFIPQRRSTETQDSSIGNDPGIERSQSEAQQSSDLPLGATEASREPARDEGPPTELKTSTSDQFERTINTAPGVAAHDDAEAYHTPTRRQTIRSTAQSHALRVESEPNKKSPRTPLTKKLERTKRTRTDTVAQRAAVADRDKSAQDSSSREAFLKEAASLDEDIKQLRIQLARKLHLQNDQLKKMLKRFDVS